jgi:hypothetical protein
VGESLLHVRAIRAHRSNAPRRHQDRGWIKRGQRRIVTRGRHEQMLLTKGRAGSSDRNVRSSSGSLESLSTSPRRNRRIPPTVAVNGIAPSRARARTMSTDRVRNPCRIRGGHQVVGCFQLLQFHPCSWNAEPAHPGAIAVPSRAPSLMSQSPIFQVVVCITAHLDGRDRTVCPQRAPRVDDAGDGRPPSVVRERAGGYLSQAFRLFIDYLDPIFDVAATTLLSWDGAVQVSDFGRRPVEATTRRAS